MVERTGTNESLAVSDLLFAAEWDVKFYSWQPARDAPLGPPADWTKVITGPPLDQQTVSRIDFDWGLKAPTGKVPADYFALVATSEQELPAGKYEMWLENDDGARVFVDGVKVLDVGLGSPIFRDVIQVHLNKANTRLGLNIMK